MDHVEVAKCVVAWVTLFVLLVVISQAMTTDDDSREEADDAG